VACGGHTGDAATMREAVRLAIAHGVEIGAHPSYPDRDGFGRVSIPIAPAVLADAIARQIDALARVAAGLGMALTHVKPHGALYNDAARDEAIAATIASGVLDAASDLIVVGLAGSRALDVWRERGLRVASEGFAGRAYEPDGTLVPRARAGAVLTDPDQAAAQAVRLARGGGCDTICVHSDTPRAASILAAVRKALAEDGWVIAALADRIRRT